jgi:CBS-domain-containing membrane protein
MDGREVAMKVYEVMTREVITARPDTSIHDAAQLMATYGVSGLPVVDQRGTVVGILSEGDLILRQRTPERRPWWRSFFSDSEALAREYRKAVGMTAGEVMTRAVVCVSPDLSIEAAASILDARRIRRLPVVSHGRLVGVVSRGDLIKVLANGVVAPDPAVAPSDADLVRELKARLARESWVSGRGIVPQCQDRIMSLWGIVESEAEKAAVETMARAIPGVRGVESHLVARSDIPYLYWGG